MCTQIRERYYHRDLAHAAARGYEPRHHRPSAPPPRFHGAKISDTVKITTYLTDMRNRIDNGKCLAEQFGSASLPAHTLLQIDSLAFPEMMIEVDVIPVASQ